MTTRSVSPTAGLHAALDPAVARGLELVRGLLGMEMERMRAAGIPVGEDDYRGLYVSDEEADRLLAAAPGPPVPIEALRLRARLAALAVPGRGPLGRLVALAGLSAFDAGCVLLCLAAEADPGFERLVGYVQDDVTKRRPRVELALRLLATPEEASAARDRFAPTAPLRRFHLLALHEEAGQPQTPLVARALALDARVAAFLLGQTALDEQLFPFATLEPPGAELPELTLPADLRAGVLALAALPATKLEPAALAITGPDPASHRAVAAALAAGAGRALLRADLPALAEALGAEAAVTIATREAAFQDAVLLLEGADRLRADDAATARRAVSAGTAAPLVILGSRDSIYWPGLAIALPGLSFEAQRALWQRELSGEPGIEAAALDSLAGRFALMTDKVRDAAQAARGLARWRDPADPALTPADLAAAARTQSTPILSGLARKITPHYSWDDIVLAADAREQLREMCSFVEHRHLVYDTWGLGKKLAMGKGLIALFAGNSGTGKTMAADVMAGTLGLDLYKIDLSGVVSKYIGETEKNLSSIFGEAETSNAILFFDEADALFGKRSEVKDAHDRYANIETAYLLQRMEEYSGMVILATNLKMNLDEAFLRRLHFVLDFPMPEEADRRRIWETTMPAATPRDSDLDFAFLAKQFKIAGGNIRNIVLAAAFMAAAEGKPVGMAHMIRGVRREYQKLGRMVHESEFGPYVGLVRQ